MMKVLFITSSSFSGSTLLSFLLNTHPGIATVGEMEGWRTADLETFRCSCGELLKACPFFTSMARVFAQNGLPFDPRDFGTGYRLVSNLRINRYLTEAVPVIRSTWLETLRDAIVRHIPVLAGRIERSNRANLLFMRSALAFKGASVFVNADKSPFRLRYLRALEDIDLNVLYLTRDPRGVVMTLMENRRWDAAMATRMWIRDQENIVRVLREFPAHLHVYYEDLCDSVNEVLGRIHAFAGLPPIPFPGDFKSTEHHILGNSMRLENMGRIVRSERWKKKLTAGDLTAIRNTADTFIRDNPGHPVSGILRRYLADAPAAAPATI